MSDIIQSYDQNKKINKTVLAYSGGLSRSYVRTYAPAAAFGFDAFSPFTVRSVIAEALAIPFEQVVEEVLTLFRELIVQRTKLQDMERRAREGRGGRGGERHDPKPAR